MKRSSSRITLVLMGVAALSACSREDDVRRDVYRSREDCLADWGNRPEDCQPASQPQHHRLGYYYGPSYGYHSSGSGATWGRGARAVTSTHSGITRGGFGASGRSSAS